MVRESFATALIVLAYTAAASAQTAPPVRTNTTQSVAHPRPSQRVTPAATATSGSAAPASDLQARVLFVRGRVEVTAPDTHPARADEVLRAGMRLRTDDDAMAEIALPNGVTLELGENSLVWMFQSPTAQLTSAAQATTTLVRGSLRVRMPAAGPTRPADVIPIATAGMTIWAGRGDALLSADLSGHITRLSVQRGRMRYRTATREFLLPAGFGAFEEIGRPPPVDRFIPRPPTWRTQPPSQILTFGEPADVSAVYGYRNGNPLPAQWRVELARDEHFHDVISSQRVAGSQTRWRGRQMVPGTYFLRVSGLDGDRFESGFSSTVRVYVAAPRITQGVASTEAAPGRRASLEIPRGFFCSVDGSTLATAETPMPLAPGRSHQLRCSTDAHGRNARETIIHADQAGPLVRQVRVDTPSADARTGTSTGIVSLNMQDGEGHPVSLALIDVVATNGVTVDPMRETDQRGHYLSTVRWPAGVRSTHLRFTINHAATFEHDAEVTPVVAAPAPLITARPAPAQTVEVIRAPVLHANDDDDE